MTTRTFCDLCDLEITPQSKHFPDVPLAFPSGTRLGSVSVRVHPINDDEHQTPDVCIHCIFDAIAKADDRPKDPT